MHLIFGIYYDEVCTRLKELVFITQDDAVYRCLFDVLKYLKPPAVESVMIYVVMLILLTFTNEYLPAMSARLSFHS